MHHAVVPAGGLHRHVVLLFRSGPPAASSGSAPGNGAAHHPAADHRHVKAAPSRSLSRTAGSSMGAAARPAAHLVHQGVFAPGGAQAARLHHLGPAGRFARQGSPRRFHTPPAPRRQSGRPVLFSLRTEGICVSSFPSMSVSWPTLCLQFTPLPPKNQPAGCKNSCLTCWAGCFILKEKQRAARHRAGPKGRFGYGGTAGRKREVHHLDAAARLLRGTDFGALSLAQIAAEAGGEQGHPLLLLFQQG